MDVSRQVSPKLIDLALARILDSGKLGQNSRLRLLLVYIVREELAGRGDRLKAYAIGVEVLGRPASFDPGTDSVVRVEFNRLRHVLELYYATTGAADPVVINIPAGGYRPRFETRALQESAATTAPHRPSLSLRHVLWVIPLLFVIGATAFLWWQPRPYGEPTRQVSEKIALAMERVQWSGAGPLTDDVASGLQRQLLSDMTKFNFIELRDSTSLRDEYIPRNLDNVFILRIKLQQSQYDVRMIAYLVDPTGVHLWGFTHDQPTGSLLTVQEQLKKRLLANLRPHVLLAARAHSQRITKSNRPLDAWSAYIQSTWIPGDVAQSLRWEEERIALARRAIAIDPAFGEAHSVLAQKLSFLISIDPGYDRPEVRTEAALHASRAMELAADQSDADFNVAFYYWNMGRLQEASDTLKRVVELDPNHVLARLLAEPTLYTCDPPPRRVLSRLVAAERELASDNPVRWLLQTFMSDLMINVGDFNQAEKLARRAYRSLIGPDTVLRLAAVLNHNGKIEEAKKIVSQHRVNWPNLDLHHYANVTIARRCASSSNQAVRVKFYRDLANAVSAR